MYQNFFRFKCSVIKFCYLSKEKYQKNVQIALFPFKIQCNPIGPYFHYSENPKNWGHHHPFVSITCFFASFGSEKRIFCRIMMVNFKVNYGNSMSMQNENWSKLSSSIAQYNIIMMKLWSRALAHTIQLRFNLFNSALNYKWKIV